MHPVFIPGSTSPHAQRLGQGWWLDPRDDDCSGKADNDGSHKSPKR